MRYLISIRSFLIIFFLLLSNNVLLAEIDKIKEIQVEGTQRIDIETIVSYANVEIDDIYTEELGNNILKDLFDTNLFSNIEISFDSQILTILIKENPTINLVKFTGNNKIKDEDLLIEVYERDLSIQVK